MRLRNDPESRPFSEYLLQVGNGTEPAVDEAVTIGGDASPSAGYRISLLLEVTGCSSQDPLIQSIFPDVEDGFQEQGYFNSHSILTLRNNVVNDFDALIAQRITKENFTYLSADSVAPKDDQAIPYSAEFLNFLTPPGIPPHVLKLKVGVPVIVLGRCARYCARYRDPSSGLCNGTRLIVRRLARNVILAKIVGGVHDGDEVHIPRITMTTTGHRWPFTLQRRQFPLQLAFAITINKAERQTLSRVGVLLSEPDFTHGQFYVALSRATRVADVAVHCQEDGHTTNVVYADLLRD